MDDRGWQRPSLFHRPSRRYGARMDVRPHVQQLALEDVVDLAPANGRVVIGVTNTCKNISIHSDP